jgi:dihydroxyacid dehydratase/phosphogluconate dehydratase
VLRKRLVSLDGVSAENVIMDPDRAKARGLRSTLCFPVGNIAPEGAVIKSTAIDPSIVDESGCYRKIGRAKVYLSESSAIDAIKQGDVIAGDIVVVICGGPLGSGMQEIYQVTSALKHLPFGKHVAVITDARFSGVSTGACIGHVSPEALAGGAIGKLKDGDLIEIVIGQQKLHATVNFIGEDEDRFDPAEGARRLSRRAMRTDLAPDPHLPQDTKLWAALVHASGGIWSGCVYDTETIIARLSRTTKA